MRFLFAIVIIFGVSIVSNARPVTKEQALKRAMDFISEKRNVTKSGGKETVSLKYVEDYPSMMTKSSERTPCFYIFNEASGGYVIISGDDCAIPVLGFSLMDNFHIDDIPENMASLLDWYEQIITYARNNDWTPTKASKVEKSSQEVVLLETAHWGQGFPFNDLCPVIDGEKCPTGCVATATAIIMRYHQWPRSGSGYLPPYEYTYNGRQVAIDGFSLGHEYDWSKMPNLPNYEPEENQQYARLLYDVGVMSKMHYEPWGSGSLIQLVAAGLVRYFNYDARFVGRGGFGSSVWADMIKKEINESRPVLYSGYNDHIGHAFVIDGYWGEYFSLNLGWGGGGGVFFTLSPIIGHEEDLMEYYKDQVMVYGIQASTSENASVYGVNDSSSASLSWDFIPGTKFDLYTDFTLYNVPETSSPISYDFQLFLADKNGVIKEAISPIITLSTNDLYPSWIYDDVNILRGHIYPTCSISGTVEEGDEIILCLKNHNGEWLKINQTKRYFYIKFTNRPLADLIKIGITRKYPFPHSGPYTPYIDSFDGQKVLYFYGYKDIYWEVYDVIRQRTVSSSAWRVNVWQWPVTDSEYEDRYVRCFYNLPTGEYQLKLRNINEELTVTINL